VSTVFADAGQVRAAIVTEHGKTEASHHE